MTNDEFCMRVLRIAAHYDIADEFWWRLGDDQVFIQVDRPRDWTKEPLRAYINCNDIFHYAADAEEVVEQDLEQLEKACVDAESRGHEYYGALLFVARKRGAKPLAKAQIVEEVKDLFESAVRA